MKSTHKKIIFTLFLFLEILLYCGFLYIDITQKASFTLSAYLKFSGILLCLLYALFMPFREEYKADGVILKTALFFTVISDLFLLLLDRYQTGMVTFCIVQSLYLIRLGLWRNQTDLTEGAGRIIKHFIRNAMVTAVILIVLIVAQVEMEGLILISCFYFISILFNTGDSVLIAARSRVKNRVLYAFGMILFLLCDINVGLFNLSDFITVNGNWFSTLYNFSSIAMWMFYLPAQVIITLSGQAEAM